MLFFNLPVFYKCSWSQDTLEATSATFGTPIHLNNKKKYPYPESSASKYVVWTPNYSIIVMMNEMWKYLLFFLPAPFTRNWCGQLSLHKSQPDCLKRCCREPPTMIEMQGKSSSSETQDQEFANLTLSQLHIM